MPPLRTSATSVVPPPTSMNSAPGLADLLVAQHPRDRVRLRDDLQQLQVELATPRTGARPGAPAARTRRRSRSSRCGPGSRSGSSARSRRCWRPTTAAWTSRTSTCGRPVSQVIERSASRSASRWTPSMSFTSSASVIGWSGFLRSWVRVVVKPLTSSPAMPTTTWVGPEARHLLGFLERDGAVVDDGRDVRDGAALHVAEALALAARRRGRCRGRRHRSRRRAPWRTPSRCPGRCTRSSAGLRRGTRCGGGMPSSGGAANARRGRKRRAGPSRCHSRWRPRRGSVSEGAGRCLRHGRCRPAAGHGTGPGRTVRRSHGRRAPPVSTGSYFFAWMTMLPPPMACGSAPSPAPSTLSNTITSWASQILIRKRSTDPSVTVTRKP